MTVINHTHRFVFIHIPKTAGTSVVAALRPVNTYRDLEVGGSKLGEAIQSEFRVRFGFGKHATIAEVRRSVGPGELVGYRTFAVVRDPVRRVASTFAFLRTWTPWMDLPRWRDYVDEFRTCSTLDDFIASRFFETSGPDKVFEPQTSWIIDNDGGSIAIDALLRIDRLQAELVDFLRTTGVPEDKLRAIRVPKVNTSGALMERISATSLEILTRRYARDFRLVGSTASAAARSPFPSSSPR